MIKTLCILGRQPRIGTAELESIYGADSVQIIVDEIVGLDIPTTEVAFDDLGGTIKLCQVIGQIYTVQWSEIERTIISNLSNYLPALTEGKLQFGISVYGLSVGLKQVQIAGIRFKQALKKTGQSVRLVPNQLLQLNSAQVLHNRLSSEKGIELVLVKKGSITLVARTTAVQNITSYTLRDRGRPKRDSRVGMLPPKLAQIIINLAHPKKNNTVLDPFCGTGVVLQEAGLMGYSIYGSDIEPRMVDYSQINLEWSRTRFGRPLDWELEVGDATDHGWQDFDVVASEVYLGQAFSAFPSDDKLREVVGTCNLITEKFLKNIGPQLKPGARLCLAVPAWQDPRNNSFVHLPLLDQIESLGYNRLSFSHASYQDLIYYRPGQIVGRELIVLTRN